MGALGFTSVVVPGYKVGRGLGYGAFSDVYTCRRIGDAPASPARWTDNLVMKVFDFGLQPLAETEVEVLMSLSTTAASNHVPRLVESLHTEDKHVLILSPVGEAILPCPFDVHVTPAMRIALLHTVRAAHQAGWIHRDIKPDNIFVDHAQRRRIVLNDWSCAAPAGEPCAFAGTRWFADRPRPGHRHTVIPHV